MKDSTDKNLKPKTKKLQALYVVNKAVPLSDYRLMYRHETELCELTYGFPDPVEGLEKGRFVHLQFREGIAFSDIGQFQKLFRYLRRNRRRLDFAHYYSTKLILFGPIISSLVGVPSLITVTGLGRIFYDDRLKYRWMRGLYLKIIGRAMRQCRLVLWQNRGDMHHFADLFPSLKAKFRYVGSAVAFPLIEQRDFKATPLRVLLVARVLPVKGIEEFLTVARALQGKEFEFVLVGPPSPGSQELWDKVQEHAAQKIIIFKNELHGSELEKEYAQAHIFYLPSHGEGLPRVMIEAGLSRLCPIASDIPANRDLVVEGGGHIVPVGEATQAIKHLQDFAADRASLERNAIAFQEHVVKNYGIEAFSQRMDALVREGFLNGDAPDDQSALSNQSRDLDVVS